MNGEQPAPISGDQSNNKGLIFVILGTVTLLFPIVGFIINEIALANGPEGAPVNIAITNYEVLGVSLGLSFIFSLIGIIKLKSIKESLHWLAILVFIISTILMGITVLMLFVASAF